MVLPEDRKGLAASAWFTSINIANAGGFLIGGSIGAATDYSGWIWLSVLPIVIFSTYVPVLPWLRQLITAIKVKKRT